MFDALIGKYRNIVVSVALFLILDASVLLMNFYISFEIADDATSVNLSGRQRMLSQRMVKSLFDIQYSTDMEGDAAPARQELLKTLTLFDQTLIAFSEGGAVADASGKDIQLEKANTEAALSALHDAREIWVPYKASLERVASESVDEDIMFAAIEYARSNNVPLLTLMNDLTVELEAVATSKATRLRIIQTIGISLAIINFFIILFHFLKQLRTSDVQLEHARKETTDILETVGEGLFLLDREFVVGSQYSAVLNTMFARSTIGEIKFEDLLKDVVSSKDLDTAQRFISLLFREDIKGNLIGDLNPLSEIEVNISGEFGKYINKYFSFTFERVYQDGVVQNILVTVVDVTERVVLEKELALAKEQNDKQIEVLTSILHANPDLIRAFIDDLFKSINTINSILKASSRSDLSLKRKLSDVFIEIHRVKGEASALGLDTFVELAHDFELNITDIKAIDELNGDDLLPLVVRLERLVKHTESVQTLAERLSNYRIGGSVDNSAVAKSGFISGGGSEVGDGAGSVNDDKNIASWSHLVELTNLVAGRQEKEVALVTSGLDELSLDNGIRSLVNDVVIQCIRNSVVHGIEPPEVRRELNKNVKGRIDVRLALLPDARIELVVKDDGYGIDVARVRAAAIDAGIYSEEELEAWNSTQLTSLIFEMGLSSSDSHSLDAGAGAGMGVIKRRVLSSQGKIRVQSRRGVGTRISIILPAIMDVGVAA